MKAEHFKKFEKKITKAIKAHLTNGGRLITGQFFSVYADGMCPIACIAGCPILITTWDFVAQACGIPFSEDDMWLFIDGFDRVSKKPISRAKLYLLGRKLRAKYLPV